MSRANGYLMRRVPDHPRATKGRHLVYEHVLVAEKALGKYLPDGVEIHHVNENGEDNRGENLVICQDRAYHKLLHRRKRALEACGHPDWRVCGYCAKYDKLENLYLNDAASSAFHKTCNTQNKSQKRNLT